MIAFLALLFAYAGFAVLSLGVRRHYVQVFGRPPAPVTRRALRVAGGAALAAALALCTAHWPGSTALVAWAGLLTVGALMHVLLLALASSR